MNSHSSPVASLKLLPTERRNFVLQLREGKFVRSFVRSFVILPAEEVDGSWLGWLRNEPRLCGLWVGRDLRARREKIPTRSARGPGPGFKESVIAIRILNI